MKKILLLSFSILYPACLKAPYQITYQMTPKEFGLMLRIEAHTNMTQFLSALSFSIKKSTDNVFKTNTSTFIKKVKIILARSNKGQQELTNLVTSLNSFITSNEIKPDTIDNSQLTLLSNYIDQSVQLMEKQQEIIEQEQVANLRKNQLHKLAIDAGIIAIGYGYNMIESAQCSIQ